MTLDGQSGSPPPDAELVGEVEAELFDDDVAMVSYMRGDPAPVRLGVSADGNEAWGWYSPPDARRIAALLNDCADRAVADGWQGS